MACGQKKIIFTKIIVHPGWYNGDMKLFEKFIKKILRRAQDKKVDNKPKNTNEKIKVDDKKNPSSGSQKKQIGAENEFLKNLPPGVKIKRIEIGPKQIIKGIIYLAIFFSILSALKNFLVAGGVTQVPISKLIEGIKNQEVSKILVSDNEIVAETKDGQKILITSKEPNISLTEILQKEGVNRR